MNWDVTQSAVPRSITKRYIMARPRKKKDKIKELQPKIKVRLDAKTVITIRDMTKLDFWKEKYPNALVIQ